MGEARHDNCEYTRTRRRYGGQAVRFSVAPGQEARPEMDRDQEWRRVVLDMGVDPSSYRALLLLPLAYVAWADGDMVAEERELILEIARAELNIGANGERLLLEWLLRRPSIAYVRRGLDALRLLARSNDARAVDVGQLMCLLAHAEAIASLKRRSAKHRRGPDAQQSRAIHEVRTWLGLEDQENRCEQV